MMNEELKTKLAVLLGQVSKSLVDIKKNGRKARELKSTVANVRKIVTEVLEQQLGGVSLEEQICISEIPDEDWLITTKHIIDYIDDPFEPVNQYEIYFLQLVDYLLTTDKSTLVSNMVFSLNKMRQEAPDVYDIFIQLLGKSEHDYTLEPDKADYSLFEHRADSIKKHSYDYLWLYRKLEDFTSKRTLASILINWVDLQIEDLKGIVSNFIEFCEPDIFASSVGKIIVDVGAGIGVTVDNLSKVYGKEYERIYAYEMSQESFSQLNKYVMEKELKNVDLRQKCVGAIKSKLFFENKLIDNGNTTQENDNDILYNIDIVRLDDDIKEAVDMIIVDVGGEELAVISGSEKMIRRCHPCVAINVDKGFESLWKTSTRLSELVPEYKFYLRHYGSFIVPEAFILYCK